MDSIESDPARSRIYSAILKSLKRNDVPSKINLQRGQAEFNSPGLLDYSEFGQYPHGYLQRFDLPVPLRGVPDSFKPALQKKSIDSAVHGLREGAKSGALDWYDMSPLRNTADQVRPDADVSRFLNLSAPMSIQTSVPRETKQASFLNNIFHETGRIPELDELQGHNLGNMTNMKIDRARQVLEHGSLDPEGAAVGEINRNAKIEPYRQVKAGNLYNPVMDSWMLGIHGLPEASKGPNKGALAMLYQELAQRAGVMPPQAQAAPWVHYAGLPKEGGGSKSDVRPYSALVESMIHEDALQRGRDPMDHFGRVMAGEDHIKTLPEGFAGGGSVGTGILERIAREMNDGYHNLSRRMPTGGAELFADNPAVLKNYLHDQVPPEWRKSLLSGTVPHELDTGSGRRIMFLKKPDGKGDAVMKFAVRPRAMRENDAEGERFLSEVGLMPKLHWRSPDGQTVIVDKGNTSPEALKEHAKFMKPMVDTHEMGPNAQDAPGTWLSINHRLQDQMRERGMERLLDYGDLLGGDLFTFKGHQYPGYYSVDNRVQSTLSNPNATTLRDKKFQLLDAGVLIPDLTHDEMSSDHTRYFKDALGNMQDFLNSPEAARELPMPRGGNDTFEFARGGIARAKLALAKGGRVTDPNIDQYLDDAEAQYDLPRGVLHAMADTESGKNPDARGKAGEIGMMQFMPATAARYKIDPHDAKQSAFGAGAHMRDLIDEFGDVESALAAWNWGPDHVRKKHALPHMVADYQNKILKNMAARGNIPQQKSQPMQSASLGDPELGDEEQGDDDTDWAMQLLASIMGEPA